MLAAACHAAYIVTAYVGMTVGRNGNESERYSNGTPADVRAESVTIRTCACGRLLVTVWCLFYIHVTAHRNRVLFKQPTRHINYPNLFCHKTLHRIEIYNQIVAQIFFIQQ
jgi:hypothetical protein